MKKMFLIIVFFIILLSAVYANDNIVKIISITGPSYGKVQQDLENEINIFLNNNDIIIKELRYSTLIHTNGLGNKYNGSVIILYENKE